MQMLFRYTILAGFVYGVGMLFIISIPCMAGY